MTQKLKSRAPTVTCAVDLMARRFEPIRWAVRDLVPEGVSLLVGAPKVGKSWLALQFALAVIGDSPVWNGRTPEELGTILMLALEDNDRRMQSRIAKLRGVNMLALDYATEWPRMDQDGLAHLDSYLQRRDQTRLVIIDTLGRFRPPENGRGSAYQQDYEVGAELKRIADRHKVALLLLHHTRKMAAADVLDSVSGTNGLAGSVDALLMLRRERGQMDAALYVTGRDIEHEQDYALKFDSDSCTWSSLGSVHEAQRSGERQRILEFVAVNGASKPCDIADGLDKNRSTTRVLLKRMLANGDLRLESGRYSLIHSIVNSVNKVNEVHGVTGVRPVDGVASVYSVHTDTPACPRCAGEGCAHCNGARAA